jgi:two-component system response regulator YesN
MDRAFDLIERRYSEPLDVAQMASEVGISPSHLFLLFRRQLGVSPAQYLNQCRIRHARQLLQETSLSIKEIGAAVGLRSQRNFCKRFRRHTGMTATDYRASFGRP